MTTKTKSIKLSPTKEQQKKIAQEVFKFNIVVSCWQFLFLSMRQENVLFDDGTDDGITITKTEWQRHCINLLGQSEAPNEFYRRLNESLRNKNGEISDGNIRNIARAIASPLTNKSSIAGEFNRQLLALYPESPEDLKSLSLKELLVDRLDSSSEKFRKALQEGQGVGYKTSMRTYLGYPIRDKDKEPFIIHDQNIDNVDEDKADKIKKSLLDALSKFKNNGLSKILEPLKQANILPVVDQGYYNKLFGHPSPRHETLAISEAITSVVSHDTWKEKMEKEYNNLSKEYSEKRTILQQSPCLALIEEYLSENEESDFDGKYRLTSRMYGGKKWETLRKKLRKKSIDERISLVQNEINGGYDGDFVFLEWICQQSIFIDNDEHNEVLSSISNLHRIEKKLEDKKQSPQFTFAHPINSPRWPRYDFKKKNAPGAELIHINQIPSRIKIDTSSEKVDIDLVKSKEFRARVRTTNNKDKIVYDIPQRYKRQHPEQIINNNEAVQVTIGESRIIAPIILQGEKIKDINELLENPINYIYLKTPSILENCADLRDTANLELVLNRTEQETLKLNDFFDGKKRRILSIDLGERENREACLSWLEVEGEHFTSLHSNDLDADLSDRVVVFSQNEGQKDNKEWWSRFNKLKRNVEFVGSVGRLGRSSNRGKYWTKLIKRYKDKLDLLATIEEFVLLPEEEFVEKLYTDIYRTIDEQTSIQLKTFLNEESELREGSNAIQHITMLRRLHSLKRSWFSRRRPKDDKPRRLPKDFDKKLLEHTANIQDNRLKSLANIIIQSALGYRYDRNKNKWIQNHYGRCDALVLEKLHSLQTKLEYTRKDNRRRTDFSCHKLIEIIKHKAKWEGIPVFDVNPYLSSQICARTNSFGLRCEKVKNIRNWIKDNQKDDLKESGFDITKMSDDAYVPWKSGLHLASLTADLQLDICDADLNASFNVGRYIQSSRKSYKCNVKLLNNGRKIFYYSKPRRPPDEDNEVVFFKESLNPMSLNKETMKKKKFEKTYSVDLEDKSSEMIEIVPNGGDMFAIKAIILEIIKNKLRSMAGS